MQTPWGKAQTIDKIAEGITHVTTASHGGIHLSPKRQKQMPAKYRETFAGGPWYEEDCDWARVAVTFPDCFTAAVVKAAKESLERWSPEFNTELTEVGEQSVIPGCERKPTDENPQGLLW